MTLDELRPYLEKALGPYVHQHPTAETVQAARKVTAETVNRHAPQLIGLVSISIDSRIEDRKLVTEVSVRSRVEPVDKAVIFRTPLLN